MATTRSRKAPARPAKKSASAKPPGSRARAKAGDTLGSRPKTQDSLATYRSKRDFSLTPEPSGKVAARFGSSPLFVIQKHAASTLHYDFRLEIDGTLKSWAVPKGPSMDPAQKRLAVETEDHPIDYADFEGTIPADEYGGGTVLVWDTGRFRNLKRRAGRVVPLEKCYENGQIEVWLDGKRVRGGFALIHSRMGGREKNWLLIKMNDSEASAGRDPVRRQGRSVLSGRTLEQVAAGPGRVWPSR